MIINDLNIVNQYLVSTYHTLGCEKSLGCHQLPGLIFTKKRKKTNTLRQILSLEKHVKCKHFSDDIVFLLTSSFFNFFLMRTRTIIFQFPKQPKKKEKITSPRYFSFFSDENQDIYLSWPCQARCSLVDV